MMVSSSIYNLIHNITAYNVYSYYKGLLASVVSNIIKVTKSDLLLLYWLPAASIISVRVNSVSESRQ